MKKILFFLIICALFVPMSVWAQEIIWDRTFGGKGQDAVESVQQTSDEGYILAGITQSYGAGDDDAWLIKTDGEGVKQWDRIFGGTGPDGVFSVRQTSDGGYILAGVTQSYGAGAFDAWLIKVGGALIPSVVEEKGDMVGSFPLSFELSQNYPNPFNGETTIRYDLTEDRYVSFLVYNLRGQKVRTLLAEGKSAGVHSVMWDGRDDLGSAVGSGIYLYQLKTEDVVRTRKALVLQ